MASPGDDPGDAGPDAARIRVESHVADAERIANHVMRRLKILPHNPLREDLVAEARAALVKAAHTYDPRKGATFHTYLYYRVSHAICDALRRDNRTLRSHRRAVARLTAQQDLLERLQEADVAAHGEQVRTLEERVRAARARVESLTASVLASRIQVQDPDIHPAPASAGDPETAVAREKVQQHVRKALASLKPLHREVLQAIYVEGEALSAYADRIGKSRSTVSRTHGRALTALARALATRAGPDLTAGDMAP